MRHANGRPQVAQGFVGKRFDAELEPRERRPQIVRERRQQRGPFQALERLEAALKQQRQGAEDRRGMEARLVSSLRGHEAQAAHEFRADGNANEQPVAAEPFALDDWLRVADFDPEDVWPRRWAEQYATAAVGLDYSPDVTGENEDEFEATASMQAGLPAGDGTATAAVDYVSTSGSITFAPRAVSSSTASRSITRLPPAG